MPFLHYVIQEKGKVELGIFSCAMSHTRVMPDGTLLKGAQGSFPFGGALAQSETIPWPVYRGLFSVPWLHPDPMGRQQRMSDNDVRMLLAAIPPGVQPRHRSSLFEPVQVPD